MCLLQARQGLSSGWGREEVQNNRVNSSYNPKIYFKHLQCSSSKINDSALSEMRRGVKEEEKKCSRKQAKNWKNIRCFVFKKESRMRTKKKKKTSITTERFHISWMVRCILWENIIYGFQPWMVMKGRKTALNVKIEKLLSVFSWQNIFIAFSSATIFLFLFNEIWCLNVCSIFLCFCSLYLSLSLSLMFNPLSEVFIFLHHLSVVSTGIADMWCHKGVEEWTKELKGRFIFWCWEMFRKKLSKRALCVINAFLC